MSLWIKLIVSLAIAIIGAIISWWLERKQITMNTVVLALLIFISTLLVCEVADISGKIGSIEERNSILCQTIEAFFEDGGTFTDFYNAALIGDARGGVSRGEITLQGEEVPSFWLKTVMFFDNSFFATSYIDPSEGWTWAYTRIGLDVQEIKIRRGQQVRRVFIVETDDELTSLIPTIREQREKGVDAKYIFRREIEAHPSLRKIEVESLDFVLIDDEFVLLIFLDRNRKISHSTLTRDKAQYETYRAFYGHLFNEAQVPK